jgi:CrcB protein
LAINLIGAFVLGVLLEALSAAGPDRGVRRAMRLTLGTGILGGFTTYSTFMVETADRLRSGHALLAIAYLVGSVIAGLLAAGLGISTAWRARRAQRAGRGKR